VEYVSSSSIRTYYMSYNGFAMSSLWTTSDTTAIRASLAW
jgi:hypothetical protein